MKIKDLVPPLELCRRIPAVAFADSALVWEFQCPANRHHGELWVVCERESTIDGDTTLPAPTLEEILRGLTAGGLDEPAAYFDGDQWIAYYKYHNSGGPMAAIASDRGAGAALRLWLQHMGSTTDGPHTPA